MTILVAIDPGVHTGIAVVDAHRVLVHHDRLRHPTTWAARVDVLRELISESGLGDITWHLVIEGQYREDHEVAERHGRRAAPWRSLLALVEDRVAWCCAAESLGWSVEVVQPRDWMRPLTRGLPYAGTKTALRAAVGARLPGLRLRADELDAVGLACWWVEERRGRVRVP